MQIKRQPIYLNGFKAAREITRQNAKSFYFASKFLPYHQRNAVYSVYAICRKSDDSVDVPENSEYSLKDIEKTIGSVYSGNNICNPVVAAFKHTVDKYRIPAEWFNELLKGMNMDLKINRYENFKDLYGYCYRVAGVVGLIMLKIFGYKDKRAEKYAVKLGIAMQLTNILRDIKEDYARGRIYIPLDEMARFKVSQDHISQSKLDENMANLIRYQINRAREYYAEAAKGIKMISGRSCRLTTAVMKNIYSGILDSIEKNNYDIYSHRAFVPAYKKAAITAKTFLNL